MKLNKLKELIDHAHTAAGGQGVDVEIYHGEVPLDIESMSQFGVVRDVVIHLKLPIQPGGKYACCRFCGTDNANYMRGSNMAPTPIVCFDQERNERYVQCEHCGARGPLAKTHEEAIDLWNNGVK